MTSEADDIQAALQGDGSAYERIIRRHQQRIGRRMFRFSRDKTEVEELTHDVFVEAYFSLRHYRFDAPLGHWLQRIATRVGYRFWKRQRRDRERIATTDIEAASDVPAAGSDEPDEVGKLLEQLPPRDRLVLTLLYVEEHSVAEAAKLAGWSQTMIKVQAFRARGKLRKLIETTKGTRP